MNGWFPKINSKGQIASGNDGIWLDGVKVSSKGTSSFWIGDKLCFNLNDGRTQVGAVIIDKAYNEYYGSDISRWTGFSTVADGTVDFYDDASLYNHATTICLAKYAGYGSIYGFNLVYVTPYQSEDRALVYNNVVIYTGKITNYVMSSNGIIAWQIATSTYGREIWTQAGRINIRSDENPIAIVDYLGQSWMVSQCGIGMLIYPIGSYMGYYIPGDLFYPDAKGFFDYILIVGSTATGEPKFNNRIYTSAPRIDLRHV